MFVVFLSPTKQDRKYVNPLTPKLMYTRLENCIPCRYTHMHCVQILNSKYYYLKYMKYTLFTNL